MTTAPFSVISVGRYSTPEIGIYEINLVLSGFFEAQFCRKFAEVRAEFIDMPWVSVDGIGGGGFACPVPCGRCTDSGGGCKASWVLVPCCGCRWLKRAWQLAEVCWANCCCLNQDCDAGVVSGRVTAKRNQDSVPVSAENRCSAEYGCSCCKPSQNNQEMPSLPRAFH